LPPLQGGKTMFQVICIATGKPVVVYAVYGGMFLIWNDEETEQCWSWMDMDQFRPVTTDDMAEESW